MSRCCGLQMPHVSSSFLFQLLSSSDRNVSCRRSLLDRRPMFVLVSLFLVCLPVFLVLFSSEYHNVLMFLKLWGPHKYSQPVVGGPHRKYCVKSKPSAPPTEGTEESRPPLYTHLLTCYLSLVKPNDPVAGRV